MKKLTAGIFATILGLTAIDAYAALPAGVSKVATTNYVDGAMGAAVTSAVTTAKTYTDTEIGKIQIPTLNGYATEAWVEQQGYATEGYADSEAAGALTDAKAYTDAKVGNLGTSTDVVSYIGAQGYLTSTDVSGLATTTYVDTQDAATLNSAKTYAESEADAAQAAAATDATTKAGQALTEAKAYTDTKVGNLGTSTDVVSYVGAQGYLKAADVSGKADTSYVNAELAKKANTADLAAVATSGSYTDLTNVPTDLVTDADIADMATKTDIADMATNAGVAATYATKAYADQAEADAISTAAADATTKAGQALTDAKAYTDAEIGDIGEMTVKAYVDAASYDETALKTRVTEAESDIDELEAGHQSQATQIGVVETDISNIKTEQTTQNNSIKALQDAAGNYVTWDDVENTYPAAN